MYRSQNEMCKCDRPCIFWKGIGDVTNLELKEIHILLGRHK